MIKSNNNNSLSTAYLQPFGVSMSSLSIAHFVTKHCKQVIDSEQTKMSQIYVVFRDQVNSGL